tara:strand:- start:106 stop:360 length:255 start_codon:yes stop_codon:yes gene_type:complete
MKAYLGVVVRRIIGCFFIVFGIASLFLPLLPGVLLTFIGLYMLALDSVWWCRQLKKIEKKFPYLHKFIIIFDGRKKKSGKHDHC